MPTSHVNCVEETDHHVEAHSMWHMQLLNVCGIGQIEQRRHKGRIDKPKVVSRSQSQKLTTWFSLKP